MNMTASSTQHHATFELGCHVCGLQETRLIEAGAARLGKMRSAWEATPGGVAIAAGPGVEPQRAPTTGENAVCMRRDGTSELSLLLALPVEWCLWCFLVLETMPRDCDKMKSC